MADEDVVGQGDLRSGRAVQTGLILGQTFGIKAVQYTVVEGQALFEGDIVLGTEQQMQMKTESLRAMQAGTTTEAVMITGAQYRWPNCRIPYDIDSSLPNQNRVTDAIAHWEANTRFRFVLRNASNASSYPDWVTFRPSSGCSSSVGRQGGQQFVNLGSGCSTGNAIHEIGHVIGLWHEQSREDRDSFVTINWTKIQPGLEHNFNQHITDGDDVGAYDYGSIMHYPRDAFSVDGSDTITPRTSGVSIGQRTALSAGDIAAANSLCPTVTIKELAKDVIADTRKELVKDIRLDTRKEVIVDTRKELIKERPKEVAKDVVLDPGKVPGGDVTNPPGGGVINPGPIINPGTIGGIRQPSGSPFAVVTPHQAPMAEATSGASAGDQRAVQLDATLQHLAEAIAQSEANTQALQQQYSEIAALLRQELDAQDQGS